MERVCLGAPLVCHSVFSEQPNLLGTFSAPGDVGAWGSSPVPGFDLRSLSPCFWEQGWMGCSLLSQRRSSAVLSASAHVLMERRVGRELSDQKEKYFNVGEYI